ncbi:hypothetical protein [Mastigocoleus sp. MO_188.B34]|uniref:hypothetical protein n=1 Tax=Mastigocoleus sp. MO_188.B34 TaxID=3036635 RepID=UPI00260A5B65|nr:hypothetical protein [Mastigocoleus sp. MO_188.B34]MDJ0694479.1 hypothetical protein [Mastigocoleus sp. MO_188.B34]
MSNQPKQTKVKVCNHKPDDKWDDGCCGDDSGTNKSSEIISNSTQKKQRSHEIDDISVNS